MLTDRYSEIDEVIAYIQSHIYEPLSLSRLAGHISYSPFHFTRIFKERMGISPLYYVSALRLQKGFAAADEFERSRHRTGNRATKPIPEGYPLYGTLISSPGYFRLEDIKPGTYYLMATSVSWGAKAIDFLLPHATLRTRSKAPIVVRPFSIVPHQQVMLQAPSPDDPPILISLSALMNNFLNRVMQSSNR